MKHFTASLALAFAMGAMGCGGTQKTKPAAGPTCADAATNIAARMNALGTEKGIDMSRVAEMSAGMVNERCPADGWSAAAIACFAKATVEEMETCEAKLTPEQDQKMQEAAQQRMKLESGEEEGDGAPDGAAPARSDDPCGGDE